MIKILFVCHGNICRSPMAEFVMKDLAEREGLADHFLIASAATSTDEIGNGVYPPVRELLAKHGISCAGKVARQLTAADYEEYDLLIGMDSANLRNMRRLYGGDVQGKIHLMLEYTPRAVVFNAGQVIADKSAAEVLNSPETVEAAHLNETSLYHLSALCGIDDPEEFTRRFIARDREVRV